MLNDWLKAILDLVFPPKCPVCRTAVAGHGEWCCRCLAAVVAPRAIHSSEHRLQSLDGCRVVVNYSGGIQRLLRDMKFRQDDRLAVYFDWLLERYLDNSQFSAIDGVVPVPLYSGRLAERGFNQTDKIFRRWCERHGFVWLEALVRTRPTLPQWQLDLAGRRRNIKGAFRVTRPDWVAGKQILLVDDIFTSGITMEECAKVLKKAGAVRVGGLALASGAD